MSVIDLRKEFVKLQKEFVGGRVTKLKKHEVEHRLSVLKQAMSLKSEVPAPEAARTGPPSARDIPTKDVSIDGETVIKKPLKPEGPDPVVKKPRGPAKPKTVETAEAAPAPAPAAAAEKPKKAVKVPPKVVFDEVEIVSPQRPSQMGGGSTHATPQRKVVKKPKAADTAEKPKSKATAEPKTAPPAPEAEPKEMVPPVVPKVIRLPGGVRKLEQDTIVHG